MGGAAANRRAADPLPSWREGAAKSAIIAFVAAAADPSSAKRIPVEDRIAAFDQDGTLWVEQPLYAQAMFALDRVRALATSHPSWKDTEPFATVLAGDPKALGRFSEADWEKIVGTTHAGMSTDAFSTEVTQWLAKAKHPRFGRPYTDLVYQPMLELLKYLRVHGFKTYIVTGGGQDFVRAYSTAVYGVPPDQVIGSSIRVEYQARKGAPVLVRDPTVFFVDDHGGKPVGIHLFSGKRSVAAVGNSDGDAEMLQWTAAAGGASLELLVHHDDDVREVAYGPAGNLPDTKVGRFSAALLEQAKTDHWIVVSMKRDWTRVFPFEQPSSAPEK